MRRDFVEEIHEFSKETEDDVLLTSVDDAIRTMAVVEAGYESSARGGTEIVYS